MAYIAPTQVLWTRTGEASQDWDFPTLSAVVSRHDFHGVGDLADAWVHLQEREYDAMLIDDFSVPFHGSWMTALSERNINHLPPLIIVRFFEEYGLPERLVFRTDRDAGVLHMPVAPPDEVDVLLDSLVASSGSLDHDGAPRPPSEALRLAFRQISDDVLRWIADHPDHVSDMHWRDFEHLVAELFDRNGLDVTLTSASGDRGADLYVARHTGLGSLLYVVECKRRRPSVPIGPGLVRELRGVVDRERANAGVLVTTSFFSQGALEEQRTIPFRISLRDNRELLNWLRGAPIF
jgi:hypothetical protein